MAGIRTAEEPRFETLGRVGEAELRRYPPRLLAEIELRAAGEEAARNAGFRPLAAYIFGANTPGARIGMTAPVAQSAGERIGMTAPVTQRPTGEGTWRIGFLMPERYSRDTLPPPTDPRISVRELPGEVVAVLRFSGLPNAAAVAGAQARLRAALEGSSWRSSGEGGAWFYDPPWAIPALRRSEAWLPVRDG